ncbi:TonB-dependent siderophore receptor [Marinivivus vitaminiproducens]|uniref:TonB-dependent siderophore receptor n=1 Tax=Marinivivus vitaminiproducens TaxID=3035935 RepID=UPI002797D937|nr:TonB-dependent siderophore receptor [Geminicoccaceae bacterium SCSIO 64248]
MGKSDAARAVRRSLLAATGLAAACLPAAAQQSGAPGDVIELGPLVVEGETVERADGPVEGFVATRSAIGTKTDTSLMETPQSISVVTADQIRALGAQNPSEALRYTPGVQVERFGNDPRTDWIKIRGFDAPYFLDGMQLPTGTYATPRYEPYGIERLEVLKGPASVLYGQTPPGGLLNFVSKKPLEESQGEVRLQYGNHDRYQGAFDLTGPLNEDRTLLYRFTALGRKSDTKVDHVNDDRVFFAPGFTWAPSERTSLTIQGHYIKDDTKALQFLPSQGTLNDNPNGDISRSRFLGEPDFDNYDRKTYGIGYEFRHELTDGLTLRQNARYGGTDTDLPVVRGFGFPAENGEITDFTNVTRRAIVFDDEVDGVTIDNQAIWETRTGPLDHTVLAGVDARRFEANFSFRNGEAPGLNVFDPEYGQPFDYPGVVSDTHQTIWQVGVYLQDQIRFDRLVLLLSGRHDWVRNDAKDKLLNTSDAEADNKFTGRAGLLYELGGGFAPYVSYATLFEQPVGVSYGGGLTSPAGATASGQPFRPTTGYQVEGGLKWQPPGTDSLVTASVFSITQEDVLIPDAANPGFQTQTGEVRVQGFELEAKVDLTEQLTLLAGYAYMDSEIRESGNPASVGNDLPVTPRHQASAFASYGFDEVPYLDGLTLGAGIRYFGDHFGDEANTVDISSYTLVDAVARYDLGALDRRLEGTAISLNANNVFDKNYVATCNNLSTCYYGTSRQVLATLSYSW